MKTFRIGQNCWIFNGDSPQKEKIVSFDADQELYEITYGNFYESSDLYKSEK